MIHKTKKKRTRSLVWGLITAAGFVVLFIFLLEAFPGPPVHKSPNVVVILIDTLRADHCSAYGYHRETTPHMKRIAENGLKLKNHFANAPWTKPSTASMVSGLHPTAHGSRMGQFEDLEKENAPVVEILKPEVETMAEVLKAGGYTTHAFITNYHLTPEFGYAQGYDFYHFDPRGADHDVVCEKDIGLMESTIEALQKNDGKPKFIWCHLMSVHGYCSPPGFGTFKAKEFTPIPSDAKQTEVVEDYSNLEQVIADYDNSIRFTDGLVGQFFDYIRAHAPNTILVVTSDHGEEFYEHGGFEHARTLYNEILRVPCVIWGPGVPSGVFTGLSDSIDLMPTILKAVGIDVNTDLRGHALFDLNNISAAHRKEVFAEQHQRGAYKRFALIREGKKMIVNLHKCSGGQTFEYYTDAFAIEKTNGFTGADQKRIRRFKRKINRYRKITNHYFKEKVGELKYKNLTPVDIKHLRSLGYIK